MEWPLLFFKAVLNVLRQRTKTAHFQFGVPFPLEVKVHLQPANSVQEIESQT